MLTKLTNHEYRKYAEKKSPKSKIFINSIKAFFIGGLICTAGQLIINLLKSAGFGTDDVSSITAIILIFLGALFTGLNIYDELGHFAGAGSIVPITGFANSIVSPAMEYRREGFVMGVGAKMFVIAGPVLVYGISASVAIGIIYFLLK